MKLKGPAPAAPVDPHSHGRRWRTHVLPFLALVVIVVVVVCSQFSASRVITSAIVDASSFSTTHQGPVTANSSTQSGSSIGSEIVDIVGNDAGDGLGDDLGEELDDGEANSVVRRVVPSNRSEWHLPRSLSIYEPTTRNSALAEDIRNRSWVQPLVLSSFVRPFNDSLEKAELFIYVTGVKMGNFQDRNLTVSGCLVGNDLYPVSFASMDVYYCKLPRRVRPGELLSVVVRNDENLKRALESPIRLSRNLEMTLEDGRDIEHVPTNLTLYSRGQISIQNGSDFRQIRSRHRAPSEEEVAKDSALFEARYEVCMVTMMKQFVNLLDDWIDYHRRLGVDHVYIIDNDATEDLSARYENRTDVEVIFWPYQRSQVQALSLVAVATRTRCEWILICDADEYVMIGVGEDDRNADGMVLKGLLDKVRRLRLDDVRFKYITMGPSGNVYIPKEAAPEAYVTKYVSQKLNVKTAAYTAREWLVSRVHFLKGKFWAKSWQTKTVNWEPRELEDGAYMVHFQFRSLEEALLKKLYGSSSIGDRNLDMMAKKELRNLSNPGQMYTEVPEHLRYTFFRGVWRAVTAATHIDGQTLVRWRGDDRCTLRVRRGASDEEELTPLGEEECERDADL